MVSTRTSLVVLSAASVALASVNIPVRRHAEDVSLDFHGHIAKRATGVPLQNMQSYYEAILSIGNPPQEVAVQIDTGSSDLWVMASSNPYCSESDPNAPNCSSNAVFNYNASSTFEINQTAPFNLTYGDNSFAYGYYAHDTVRLGNLTATDATLAIALESNSSVAVFGIGPIYAEASVTDIPSNGPPGPTYPNIPAQLKEEGEIQRIAYSLWLNDPDAGEGSLLMGGVDHDKYTGDLTLVPLVDDFDSNSTVPQLPFVMLHGVSVYKDSSVGTIAELAAPVLLDSGTTLVYLPQSIVDAIAKSSGSEYNASLETYIRPCSNIPMDGLIFNFSGTPIKFPNEQLFIVLTDTDNAVVTDSHGRDLCGMQVSGSSGPWILGDSFLQGVYAAYDYESFQAGLAQAIFNVTDSNIEEIITGIPGTSAELYSSTDFEDMTTFKLSLSSATDTRLTLISSASGHTSAVPTGSLATGSATASSGSHKNDANVPGASWMALVAAVMCVL